MSRSRKKHPIIKDKGYAKELYWGTIRSRHKSDISAERDLSNPKSVVNDYSYSDYRFEHYGKDCWCWELYGRKKCLSK